MNLAKRIKDANITQRKAGRNRERQTNRETDRRTEVDKQTDERPDTGRGRHTKNGRLINRPAKQSGLQADKQRHKTNN